jgi:Fe-S-cluster containining protein
MTRPTHHSPYRVIACAGCELLVPFVCRRCGRCCRNYDPIVELELLPEIARHMGEPISVIQDRLGANSLAHSGGRPTDCCFLHPRQPECLIYEIRPTACRQFPPLSGGGAGAVDCPGYREYSRVLNAFTGLKPGIRQGPSAAPCGRIPLPGHVRGEALRILTAAGVSDEYHRVFEALNGMPDSSRGA